MSNMCIVIIYFQVGDVINLGINLSSIIKPFSYMTKFKDKNINILRMKEKSLYGVIKSIFHQF